MLMASKCKYKVAPALFLLLRRGNLTEGHSPIWDRSMMGISALESRVSTTLACWSIATTSPSLTTTRLTLPSITDPFQDCSHHRLALLPVVQRCQLNRPSHFISLFLQPAWHCFAEGPVISDTFNDSVFTFLGKSDHVVDWTTEVRFLTGLTCFFAVVSLWSTQLRIRGTSVCPRLRVNHICVMFSQKQGATLLLTTCLSASKYLMKRVSSLSLIKHQAGGTYVEMEV